MKPPRVFGLVAIATLLVVGPVSAALGQTTKTWTGTTDGLWTDATNWDPSGAPASGNAVVFDGTGSNLATDFNGTAFTLSSLTFTADQTAAVTITTTSSAPLTLNAGTVLSVAAGSHRFVGSKSDNLNRDLTFSGSAFTFSIGGTASFDVNGRVGLGNSAASYTKTGTGTLILSANNGGSGSWNFSSPGGSFQVQQGILRVAATNAMGNSANRYIVSASAALEVATNVTVGNGTITLNGTGIAAAGALRSISGTRSISTTGSGGVVLASASSIGVDAGTLTISAPVTGDFPLTKVGSGTLTLSGSGNAYSGPTTVSAGTLVVDGAISAASSLVSVASGATLGGSGTIGRPVSILGGGILAPGSSPGTLTINNTLALDGLSVLAFEIDAASTTPGGGINDLITGVTDLTLGGTLNLSGSGDFSAVTAGTSWRLINYSGTLSGNGFTIGSAPALPDGLSFSVDTAIPNQVNVVVVPEPSSLALAAVALGGAALLAARRRRA